MEKSNYKLKSDLCYASSGFILNRNLSSTGFLVDSMFLQNDEIDEIAENYVLNTSIDQDNHELVYSINKYLKYPFTEMTALSGNVIYSGLKKTALEKSYRLDIALEEAIKKRKSSRKYTGDYVPENYLSTILRASSGITHYMTDGESIRQQRTCASGGGLYPVKIYILVNNLRNMKHGVYVYDPLQDCLFNIENNQNELIQFIDNESKNEIVDIKSTTFILFFTIECWKSISKYGSAGLKFAHIEIGEMAQNAHLAAACLGLGACAYASFSVKSVNKILKIDGNYESFQHAIVFGINAEK